MRVCFCVYNIIPIYLWFVPYLYYLKDHPVYNAIVLYLNIFWTNSPAEYTIYCHLAMVMVYT